MWHTMKTTFLVVALLGGLLLGGVAAAQSKPAKQPSKTAAPKTSPQDTAPAASPASSQSLPNSEYSGMYSFLQEGEFVQLDFQPEGKLGGFVSRYGTLESDKGAFLDQFIKSGSYKSRGLSFTTAPVHGVWYEFKGHLDRGPGKSLADDGYYVVTGTLTEYSEDANKKTSARSREVSFKSFPQDEPPPK